MEEAKTSCIYEDGVLTMKIEGEIDHHSAVTVRADMDREIFFYRPPKVTVDLSGITFMDSSGLGLLLGRYTKVKDIGSVMTIKNPSNEIMRILKLAGAEKILLCEGDNPKSEGPKTVRRNGSVYKNPKERKITK